MCGFLFRTCPLFASYPRGGRQASGLAKILKGRNNPAADFGPCTSTGETRMKRRLAQLPLHSGKAPPWLFRRMTQLAQAVAMAIVDEFGPDELLGRLADPWWFQAFGCALGFDWHSSGVTTVTCGALKEASKRCGSDLGIFVAGGKGGVSRKTPQEIDAAAQKHAIADGERLIYASRISAKVDSAAVQDGFALYHHAFFFTAHGSWCVVQQGMNDESGWARRYHWLGKTVEDFVCEPHAAIQNLTEGEAQAADDTARRWLLNMVAREAEDNRRASVSVVLEPPQRMLQELEILAEGPTLFAPQRHRVLPADVNLRRLRQIVVEAHEQHPQDFESLLGLRGVGPAAVRSLSLLAEIIFQAPPSHRDPAAEPALAEPEGVPLRRWADYSYAHGGKDGTPFPVSRETYDRNIAVLTDAVRRARIGENDKFDALRRLGRLQSAPSAEMP